MARTNIDVTFRVCHRNKWPVEVNIGIKAFLAARNHDTGCQKMIAMRYGDLVKNQHNVNLGRIDYNDLTFTKLDDTDKPPPNAARKKTRVSVGASIGNPACLCDTTSRCPIHDA